MGETLLLAEGAYSGGEKRKINYELRYSELRKTNHLSLITQ